jgi:methylamine dehydrogenase accessory protein MauD
VSQLRSDALILTLMGIIILLMLAIVGLFVRMNQLQSAILEGLQPFRATGTTAGLDVGAEAPPFKLSDTDANQVSLEDFAGQTVLLAFTSLRCPACEPLYPDLAVFADTNHSVQLIVVSQGSLDENRRLVEQEDLGFPVLIWEDSLVAQYEVPGTPFFYLVGGDGVIVEKGVATTLAQVEELVAAWEE